jgi:hypothetical protein
MMQDNAGGSSVAGNPSADASFVKAKGHRRDKAITIALFLLLLWQFGFFDPLSSLTRDLLKSNEPPKLMQNFNVVVPVGDANASIATGELAVIFMNAGVDDAEITGITLINMVNGKECSLMEKFPLTLESEQTFTVTAKDCDLQKLISAQFPRIGAVVSGKTTFRSQVMASNVVSDVPGENVPDSQVETLRNQRKEAVEKMDEVKKIVPFNSTGVMPVTTQ